MHRMWVLKKQPYRETSVLVSVLGDDDILYRGVARGGRGRCAEFQPVYAVLKASTTGLARISTNPRFSNPASVWVMLVLGT